jgi:DNA processing protein
MLYVMGETGLLQRPAVAIVGSREASAAGTKLARQLAAELGRAGLVVVSGLARGIDRSAHEAALQTGTIAVLAGGIDSVYPSENAELQGRIGEQGALVTEMPPGFEPRAKDFPRRNRIISGMSLGVLVIEAARKSGTLVTARMAGEQGREVFAVPGHPLDPRAEGTNGLLKTGATLVTEADDILETLLPLTGLRPGAFRDLPSPALEPQPSPAPLPPAPLTDTERARVLGVLGPHPVDIDEVVRATGLDIRCIRIILMELDLAGRIERHGGQLVSLLPDLSTDS